MELGRELGRRVDESVLFVNHTREKKVKKGESMKMNYNKHAISQIVYTRMHKRSFLLRLVTPTHPTPIFPPSTSLV
jgi:hypothetical protein